LRGGPIKRSSGAAVRSPGRPRTGKSHLAPPPRVPARARATSTTARMTASGAHSSATLRTVDPRHASRDRASAKRQDLPARPSRAFPPALATARAGHGSTSTGARYPAVVSALWRCPRGRRCSSSCRAADRRAHRRRGTRQNRARRVRRRARGLPSYLTQEPEHERSGAGDLAPTSTPVAADIKPADGSGG